MKRSPKKERSLDGTDKQEQISQLERELNDERPQGKISFYAFENEFDVDFCCGFSSSFK